MTIDIEKTSTGFAVKFPYELKDDFRRAFRSAKWNPNEKRWQVGPRSRKRLEQWVEVVRNSGVLEDLEAHESADLAEEEVQRLQSEILQIQKQLDGAAKAARRANEARDRALSMKAELAERKADLQPFQEARAQAEKERDSARSEVMSEVATLADVEEIDRLRAGMKSEWRAQKAVNRQRFEEKQGMLRQIRDDLRAADIESRALNLAVGANYNRPDRDKPDLDMDLEFNFSDPSED
jgi:hypothetical protein